jgi:hypothetical protein
MCRKLALLALVCVLLVPASALAQQTGSVSGGVFDRSGAPVAGATVRISGDPMPVARTMVTSENGLFSFGQLLPGTYRLEVEKTGVGKMSRAVAVEVARDTQNDFILGAVTEEVTVVARTPEVDLKSTEVAFNFKREFIQDLPLDRSYYGLFQLIPGVADNGTSIGPNAGGAKQDNTYLMDGVNITNPLFGYFSTEVNELDIVEINIKRGAISAEFGRSTGFVSNAVSKSGTNLFTGNYRFEAIPNEWIEKSDLTIRSATDRWVNAFDVGGPIKKNDVFFYGSARIFRSQTTRGNNNFGPLPNRKERTNEGFGKVTARLGTQQFVNAGYRHRPTKVDYAGIGANDSPAVATNTEGTNRVANANYNLFIGSRTAVEAKYVHMDEQGESIAVTDLGFQPTPFNFANLSAMGQYTSGTITLGGRNLRLERFNYKRDEIKATVSQFFDFGGTNHQIKAGFGWDVGSEDLTRKSNGWGTVSNVIVGGVQYFQGVYYPEQPSQFSIGRTYSLFLQDGISLNSRLTVNAGVLLTRDEFAQKLATTNTFLKFGMGDEVQPRIGFNYQLRRGVGDKVYANWGRYYALDQKSSARSLAPNRLYTETALFNLFTGALVSQTPDVNTTGKIIDPALKPPFTDEVIVGYATPLSDGWSLDAFFQYRDADNFIEDVPTVLPFSSFVYKNDFVADRKYRTVTLELNRLLRDRWSMNLSYAWSRFYGNYDQDYNGSGTNTAPAAIFNTSSLLNDGPGAFVEDTFRRGLLSADRTHVYKILATWMPPWIERATVGLYVRGQSGTPWEARGLPWGSTVTYLRYLEPAGSNRNAFWTNVDLLLKYGVRLDAKRTVRLEGRILNLFNQETALGVDQRKYLDPRNRTIVGTPTPGCLRCYTDAMAQGTSQPNPNFGRPTSYAAPRRLLMSLLFDF